MCAIGPAVGTEDTAVKKTPKFLPLWNLDSVEGTRGVESMLENDSYYGDRRRGQGLGWVGRGALYVE